MHLPYLSVFSLLFRNVCPRLLLGVTVREAWASYLPLLPHVVTVSLFSLFYILYKKKERQVRYRVETIREKNMPYLPYVPYLPCLLGYAWNPRTLTKQLSSLLYVDEMLLVMYSGCHD
jgi:hypothetical protein